MTELEYKNAVKFCAFEFVVAYLDVYIPAAEYDNIKLLRQTISRSLTKYNGKVPDNVNEKMDLILQYELSHQNITLAFKLPNFINDYPISLYKGDITALSVDCIVNAANSTGLGCLIPNHKCIDNIIHDRAGPRMREECRSIMSSNSHIDPGNLIITRGYNLPCRHVFHTVGPIYSESYKEKNKLQLIKCYINCMQKLAAINQKSIAFPCISTGEYKYPKHEASLVAIATIKKWLQLNKSSKHVIFCVYTDEDEHLYKKILKTIINHA